MAQWVGQVGACPAASSPAPSVLRALFAPNPRLAAATTFSNCAQSLIAPLLVVWLLPAPPLLQNYPATYHSRDYDSLLSQPAVAAAVAEHMAANAASRPATPTAAEAEAAAAAQASTSAAAAAAAAPVEAAGPVDPAAQAAAQTDAKAASALAPVETRAASPPRGPSPPAGSLPPSPKDRPLSAAAAEAAVAAGMDPEAAAAALAAQAAGEMGADPTLGQVFASFLGPQFQQAAQKVKTVAGAAAAAAQHQLTAAQAQLAAHGGPNGGGMPATAGAVAGGLLEAVAGVALLPGPAVARLGSICCSVQAFALPWTMSVDPRPFLCCCCRRCRRAQAPGGQAAEAAALGAAGRLRFRGQHPCCCCCFRRTRGRHRGGSQRRPARHGCGSRARACGARRRRHPGGLCCRRGGRAGGRAAWLRDACRGHACQV